MMKKSRHDSGLTMMEVIIASIILTALVTMSSYLVWNTSKTVSSSEVGVQMEVQARDFMSQLAKELHQSSFGKDAISVVLWDPTLIVSKSSFNAGTPTPGSKQAYGGYLSATSPKADGTIPSGATVFSVLRFRIPGPTLDLTTKNADHDKDPANFDLKAFKASTAKPPPDWTTEIQYWWEFDQTNRANEGSTGGTVGPAGPGSLKADGVDNNGNGVIDEGVIRRMETTYDVNNNVIKRSMTTVLRDVQYIPNVNPNLSRPGLVFCIPNADSSGKLYPSGEEKRLFVSVTMERADPQNPTNRKRNYVKQVATYIDVRN